MILFIGATSRKKRANLGGSTVKIDIRVEYLSDNGVNFEVLDTADLRIRITANIHFMISKLAFKHPERIIASVFNDSASRLYKLLEIVKIGRKTRQILMLVGGNFEKYIDSERRLIGMSCRTSIIFAQSCGQAEQLRLLGLS